MKRAPAPSARPSQPDRRQSSSRSCAFGLGDHEILDLLRGSLSRILLCFVEDDDPQWGDVVDFLESVASGDLRCLVGSPSRCRTAAPLLGYRGVTELLVVTDGRTTNRISLTTPSERVLELVAEQTPRALPGSPKPYVEGTRSQAVR